MIDFELKLDANSDGFQWIKILPAKKLYIAKYNKEIDFGDKQLQANVLNNYNSANISKPILDKNHDFLENYGEFGSMEVRNDGIYLQIKLNKFGVELVKNGVYRYISPTIGSVTGTDGKEYHNVLIGISLTNMPALQTENPELTAQIKLNQKKEKDINQKEKKRMNQVCHELQLNADSSEASVLKAVQDLKVELSTAKSEKVKLAQMTEEQATKIKELADQLKAAVDECTQMKESEANKEAESVVQMSITEGRILPAHKDKWIKRYKEDKEGVKLELSSMPVITAGQQSVSGANVIQANGLTVELSAYMDKIGLDKKDKADIELATKKYAEYLEISKGAK